MCFYIDLKHSKIKVATKDITCYKRIRDTFQPEHYHSSDSGDCAAIMESYKLNEPNKIVPLIIDKSSCIINKGYHSYSNKKSLDLLLQKRDRKLIKVLCIIPKDTKYYYNSLHREYVSETIIIKKIIIQ